MRFGIDRAYIVSSMKKAFENMISFFGEVKKGIGIYLAIQRYARVSRKVR